MKKLFFILFLSIFLNQNSLYALRESGTSEAKPIVGYGKDFDGSLGGALQLNSSGELVIWSATFGVPPDIVADYTAWVKWKDARINQFERHAPLTKATRYYVSSSDGSDLDDGLSEANAWATRAKAISELSTNERISFKCGDTFTDDDDWVITVDDVTIDTYGTCTGTNEPFFNAFTVQYLDASNVWALAAGNRYTVAETNDIAYVRKQADRLGETAGLPLIRQDSSANCEATSNSFFYDSVGDVLHLNLGGTDPNTIDLEAVISNSNNGVEFQGDGSRAEGLRADGFGIHRTSVGTQAQPFTNRNSGDEANLYKGLEGYYSNTHVMAHNLQVGSGGKSMWLDCIAGLGQVDPTSDAMSDINTYSQGSGQETWVIDSTFAGGALPEFTWDYAGDKTAGTGFLGHSGGTQNGTYIAFGNTATVLAGTRVNSITDFNDPILATVDSFTTFRAFNVNNVLDAYPSAHQDVASDRSTSTIHYGVTWNMRPPASAGAGGFRNDEWNSTEYCFNCRFIADMTDYGNQVGGFYNGTAGATSAGTIVNSEIVYKNWTVTSGTTRYGSGFDNRTNTGAPGTGGSSPKDRVFNTIVSVDTSGWPSAGQGTVIANLAFSNQAQYLKNNAYFGFKTTTNQDNGLDNTVGGVILAAAYNTSGTDVTALHQAGDTTFMLSHDINSKRRTVSSPDIGPVDYSS